MAIGLDKSCLIDEFYSVNNILSPCTNDASPKWDSQNTTMAYLLQNTTLYVWWVHSQFYSLSGSCNNVFGKFEDPRTR